MRLIVVIMGQVVAAALVAVAASACSGEQASSAASSEEGEDVTPAAVRPAGDSYMEALASGTLRADRSTGCLWLEGDDSTATVQLLLQGEDYSVDFSQSPPSVLYGDSVLARVGQHIEVAGGLTERDEGVEGCPVEGRIFLSHFEQKRKPFSNAELPSAHA